MLVLQIIGLLLLLLVGAGLIIRLLNPLPPLGERRLSYRLTDTGDTLLGRSIARLAADHDGLSGVLMLDDAHDAFAARILLARAAERSLDVQYYIWHGDMSGTLMLDELRAAADRGVRVRMLLDDNGIAGLDQVLAALNSHPNIEIRLFNPFVLRSPKMLGYLADFFRLNRRMHNKSFVSDNQAVIIGGRNIGDEYFAAQNEGLFADLDVLAIGPVVDDVSRDFDSYWKCRSAYPAELILPPPHDLHLSRLSRRASFAEQMPAARAYVDAVKRRPLITQLANGSLPFRWAPIRMVSDDPAKGKGKAPKERLLGTALMEIIGNPAKELRLISGYFVPTRAGTEAFSALAKKGVDVAIFTNGFEATDVWIVHAGYAGRRKALLKSGVRLFEMCGGVGGKRRRLVSIGSGGSGSSTNGQVLRSSGSMLHAKTFAVDRKRLFIGSFNFDPRSMHLNTELGFVIESEELAMFVAQAFDKEVPAHAYEVELAEGGGLRWRERLDHSSLLHDREPGMSIPQRAGVWLLAHLPIEWLL